MPNVRLFSFAAGEFLDEEMWYIARLLSIDEKRPFDEVEAELKAKVTYPVNSENRNHPFEAWGPQELVDRINGAKQRVSYEEAAS